MCLRLFVVKFMILAACFANDGSDHEGSSSKASSSHQASSDQASTSAHLNPFLELFSDLNAKAKELVQGMQSHPVESLLIAGAIAVGGGLGIMAQKKQEEQDEKVRRSLAELRERSERAAKVVSFNPYEIAEQNHFWGLEDNEQLKKFLAELLRRFIAINVNQQWNRIMREAYTIVNSRFDARSAIDSFKESLFTIESMAASSGIADPKVNYYFKTNDGFLKRCQDLLAQKLKGKYDFEGQYYDDIKATIYHEIDYSGITSDDPAKLEAMKKGIFEAFWKFFEETKVNL